MIGPSPGANAGRAALNLWLRARVADWAALGNRLTDLQNSRAIAITEALNVATEFRRVGHDLSLAQQLGAPVSTIRYLGELYAGLHQALTRPTRRPWRDLRRTMRDDVPASMYALRARLFWVAALFLAAALGGWILISSHPQLVSLFASEEMIDKVEAGELWTDGLLSITPPAVLSTRIFTNNIMVALMACCVGALYGLGTFYIIGFNGFMLGGTFAFVGQHHMALRLFEFIVAHGIVELSTIVVAGAVGVSLGEALVRPGLASRRDAFEEAARRASGLILVCLVFLVGAGLIEGYVSPNPIYPLSARIVIGSGYMVLFVTVITGTAWRRAPARYAARP
jgi:uncharacterized membrane protein SpoIIM required for sporulation